MAWALLALTLAAYVYFLRGNFANLAALAWRDDRWARRRRYRLRILKAWLLFGGVALADLALLGRLDALATMPPAFAPLALLLGNPLDGTPDRQLMLDLALGLAGGSVIGLGWTLLRRRRGKRPPMLGDWSSLLPADRGEALLAGLGALTAGVTEELFFRLAIPLLTAAAWHSATAGFIVSTALFGYAHRYQGTWGVLATTALGAAFGYVYLLSGELWLAMALHVVIDFNGLVLRPLIGGLPPRAA